MPLCSHIRCQMKRDYTTVQATVKVKTGFKELMGMSPRCIICKLKDLGWLVVEECSTYVVFKKECRIRVIEEDIEQLGDYLSPIKYAFGDICRGCREEFI